MKNKQEMISSTVYAKKHKTKRITNNTETL